MGEYMMTAVSEQEAAGLEVFDTGVSMMGLKGDDWHCGHCGRLFMTKVDLRGMKVKMAYRCACGGLSVMPEDGA